VSCCSFLSTCSYFLVAGICLLSLACFSVVQQRKLEYLGWQLDAEDPLLAVVDLLESN
jgi:hypothetical protein